MLKEETCLFYGTDVFGDSFPFHGSLLRNETMVRLTATLPSARSTIIIDVQNKHPPYTFIFLFLVFIIRLLLKIFIDANKSSTWGVTPSRSSSVDRQLNGNMQPSSAPVDSSQSLALIMKFFIREKGMGKEDPICKFLPSFQNIVTSAFVRSQIRRFREIHLTKMIF